MKLMVLDGNSVINRAYYGVRALTTRDGFFTNAIYGFLNILEKLRADEKPDALCVAFDLKAPTFRHLKYDAPSHAGRACHADARYEGCAAGHAHPDF